MPAISVIIPMYNAEKYIGDCLNSILNQTFTDFEVIVVDDCSTDNSCAVVKSYTEKFNGRLKLLSTEKNSGGGGYVPRNIGLKFSSGEYIFFVDADDFIIKNALEILNMAATQYQAEVVYTSAYYLCDGGENFKTMIDVEGSLKEDKISLTLDAPNKNLQRLLFEGNFPTPWTKFIRRDFLTQNKIAFPQVVTGGDFIWTIEVFCHAKRFLRLPVPLYFYRSYPAESVSHKKRPPQEQIYHWMAAFVAWLKAFNELSNKIEILKQRPAYCAQSLNMHFNNCLTACFEERMQLNTQDIYENLYREFAKENDSTALTLPFFLSVIDAQQKELLTAQRRIAELEGV